MSSKRRRDDGWEDSRRDDGWEGRVNDAQDSRPGPWLDGGTEDRSGRGYPAPAFHPLNESANGRGSGSGSDGVNGANGYGPGNGSNGYGAGG